MPPDHGAACVQLILNSPELRSNWSAELTQMRQRIAQLRQALSTGLRERLNNNRYDYIANQLGMFSLLGLSKEQVTQLRSNFGIYMPDDSRANLAGLNMNLMGPFVDGLVSVTQ
jgi:aspartate/tyrosine/aromatic aminotransferase